MKLWSREKNIDFFTFLCICFSPHFTFWSVQLKIWCDEGWKEFSPLVTSFIHVLFIQQIFLSMYYVPDSVLGLGVKWWSKSWWRKSAEGKRKWKHKTHIYIHSHIFFFFGNITYTYTCIYFISTIYFTYLYTFNLFIYLMCLFYIYCTYVYV